MSFAVIRSKIVEVIEAIPNSPIQEVSRVEKSFFNGYPAVCLSPTALEADYHETNRTSERRTYVFRLRAYYPFVEGQEDAEIKLEEVIDLLLATFQNKAVLGTAADWVIPIPAVWGYQKRGDGEMRIAELVLQVVKHY